MPNFAIFAEAVSVDSPEAHLVTTAQLRVGLRVLDVTNPGGPQLLGACRTRSQGTAVLVCDSLAYVAEDYRLEIFSIANPRAPRLVGSCAVSHAGTTLWLQDTLAYANQCIFNIKNPANPFIVGSFGTWPYGNCVRDTFAYLAINVHGLQVWSVADPAAPYLIDSVHVDCGGYDVTLGDSVLYFSGVHLRVFAKLTISGGPPGQTINFYYDETNPYHYGHLIEPGQDQGQPEEYYWKDLACRIEGVNYLLSREEVELAAARGKLPDVALDSFWLRPEKPRAHEPVQFGARVRNVGRAKIAQGISVTFYVSDDSVAAVDSRKVLASAATLVLETGPVWIPKPGDYLLQAEVSPIRSSAESDYDNNVRYLHRAIQ